MTSERYSGDRNRAQGISGLFLCALLLAHGADVRAGNELLIERQAMSDDELDGQRGGFVIDGGITISFGIEQIVLIDGVLQTTKTVNVPQVSGIPTGSLNFLQSGPGNTFDVSSMPAGVKTIIQNTLDQITVQNMTVINATVSNLASVRLGQLIGSLNQQIARSLR